MLRRTFCHLPRIGARTEASLWEAGITSWDELPNVDPELFSPARREQLLRGIDASEAQLARGDARSFTDGLQSRRHWRLYPSFRRQTAYLDIETTGLGAPGDIITTIALYDGERVQHFVHGQNLDAFPQAIEPYRVLVTYNGKCFDVPFIERFFHIRLEQAHLDLRYILRQVGLSGGLKGCERALGLERDDVAGLDGFHAVLLWREWKRHGWQKSLETLLAYNVEDTINLEGLMVYAYNRLLQQTPFAGAEAVPEGKAPDNPFQADRETVARMLASQW